jgi:hypothetical protein
MVDIMQIFIYLNSITVDLIFVIITQEIIVIVY